jgi:uncharacterized membrane protein
MTANNLTTLDYCLLWYLVGTTAMFIYLLFLQFYRKAEIELKVEDLVVSALLALVGPVLWLIPIFKFLIYLVESYGKVKSKVVWRNKRAKNKDILFGE